MFQKVIRKIEEVPMTLTQWGIGFIGILFIRFVLESISSPTPSGIIPSDAYTLVHYGLFFLAVMLGFIWIIGYFTKDYLKSSKFVLFIMPIIWTAPLFDIVLSRGNGAVMTYIYDSGTSLFLDFFRFIGLQNVSGVTHGMQIEIAIFFVVIGYYVWQKRNSFMSVLFCILSIFTLIYFVGTLPSLIYTLGHIGTTQATDPKNVIEYIFKSIFDSNIFHNTLHDGPYSVTPFRFLQLGFDKLMSQMFFIMSCVFGLFILWKINSEKFYAVMKNARPKRIMFYLTMLGFGMGGAYVLGVGKLSSWIDVTSIICLTISWVSLWMQAVHVNDIADVNIDRISNSDRPLVQKTINEVDMNEIGYLWLGTALLGAWSVGYYPFFMCLVYIAISYIYSVPPLRLKRVPMLSSFLIAMACLVTVLAGFFFVSSDKLIHTFPILTAMGILIIITLEANFKDMKDIDGDRRDGVLTLPVLFKEKGPMVVGVCFALSFLLVPIFLSFYSLYIVAIPCSIIGYKLITKKPYKENPIFILHFVFLIGIVILTFVTPWIANR